MNEIITISRSEFNGSEVNAVDARELHSFLESKQEFSHWIKNRIEQYGFVQGVDFTSFDKIIKRENGSTTRIEYMLSIDMAKELSMVERNEKGKQARLYFLECEKKALAPTKALPGNYKEALLQLVEQVEENEKLQITVNEQAPKVAALDLIQTADGLLNLTNTAKTLQIHPNKRLFDYLNANSWIYRRVGGKGWVAYQNRIKQGLLTHKVTTVTTTDGREKILEQVLVTPKGLAKLASAFNTAA